jgi:hypothetical protein
MSTKIMVAFIATGPQGYSKDYELSRNRISGPASDQGQPPQPDRDGMKAQDLWELKPTRSGINLSASSLVSTSGRAHGNEAFMRMIALAAGRPRFCLPGQTKPFALSLSLMAMEDTTT